MTREEAIKVLNTYDVNFDEYTAEEIADAIDMAIEALNNSIQMSNIQELQAENGFLKEMVKFYREQQTVEVVRCKDCRHADECHKSVQYTRNEPRTVTIGYTKIDFCSHGEGKDKTKFPATYNTNTKCGGCIHLDELGRCLNFMLAKDDRSCWRGSWENNNGELAEQTERREE